MAECYKCGSELSESKLFDVITGEGIQKICSQCQEEEDLPVVKKPTTFQLRDAEVGGTVYERLSNLAGVDAKEHMKKFHPTEVKKREEMMKHDMSLRQLVDKNYKEKNKEFLERPVESADLIHNFHWIIMRTRRMKKLTQAQMAKEIGESETAIKMAEAGRMPADSLRLARKIEAFLGIKLLRDEVRKNLPVEPKDLFEGVSSKDVTIGHLRDLQAKKNTLDMVEEMEEEEELNTKKKGFFGRLFSSKKKDKEVEEDIVLDEEV